jgi:hypothetical protein
VEVFSINK